MEKIEFNSISDTNNKVIDESLSGFKYINSKADYMSIRRALTDTFLLFCLFDFNSNHLDDSISEWLDSIDSLSHKFSTKLSIYMINFSKAEDALLSALIENFNPEKKDSSNYSLPLFAFAHPHIPEIEIPKNITSIYALYKAVETNYNFYVKDFEREKALTLEKAQSIINSFPVVIFIKGTPINPFCKFSKSFMQVIKKHKFNYRCFNIFEDDKIRGYMKFLHGFKTFPQIFVNSKLVGGLDIITELDSKGEFIKLIPQECTYESIVAKVDSLINNNDYILFRKVSCLRNQK